MSRPKNPPEGMARINPYLFYQDVKADRTWLEGTFGFARVGGSLEIESGAKPLTEPTDMFWGDRMYAVRDLEGRHRSFVQHVRNLALQDLAGQARGEAG